MMRKKQRSRQFYVMVWMGALLFAAVAVLAMLAALYFQGTLAWYTPYPGRYPIRGVDVSAWQGEIDWQLLSKQNVRFAFIKATEGGDFVDRRFAENWQGAAQTQVRVGAYHFFRYETDPALQAENFIRTVPRTEGMLPPVVDVEAYRGMHAPSSDTVRQMLRTLLGKLEAHYQKRPILYCTRSYYHKYLSGHFDAYPIWARSLFIAPSYTQQDCSFWQYNSRGKLKGYHGAESYIDLNVFWGDEEDWQSFCEASR